MPCTFCLTLFLVICIPKRWKFPWEWNLSMQVKKRMTISMSELPNSKLYMSYIHTYIYILYIFKFYDSRNPGKKLGMIAPKPGTFSKVGRLS